MQAPEFLKVFVASGLILGFLKRTAVYLLALRKALVEVTIWGIQLWHLAIPADVLSSKILVKMNFKVLKHSRCQLNKCMLYVWWSKDDLYTGINLYLPSDRSFIFTPNLFIQLLR